MKRLGVVLILLLAFGGIADSAYIAQHEADGTPLICSINNLSGCNIVAASHYSYLFGIPIAQYGILFYAIVFVLAALELVVFDELLRRALMWISLIGAAISLYLAVIEIFIIGALCVYCLASTAIAVLIFVLAIFIHVKQRGGTPKVPPSHHTFSPHLRMPPASP